MSKFTRPDTESSLTCGFYNGVNSDRKYSADQMSSLFEGIINDGVFISIGDLFAVEATQEANTVTVGSGRAWFNGTWSNNDAPLPVALPNAENGVFNRIDAIVLQVNTNMDVRDNTIEVVKGFPSENPVRPTLLNENGIYQHALAYIYRPAGINTIGPDDITPVVGTSETPYSTGIMETASIDYLYANWEAQFVEWFNSLRDVLSGDVAGNLQNEIEAVEAELRVEIDGVRDDFCFRKVAEFTEAGTYTWTPIPNRSTVMFVLAGAGAGGNGGVNTRILTDLIGIGGDGGDGGDVVITDIITIDTTNPINIVVGEGGAGGIGCDWRVEYDPSDYPEETAARIGKSGQSTTCMGIIAAGGKHGKYNQEEYYDGSWCNTGAADGTVSSLNGLPGRIYKGGVGGSGFHDYISEIQVTGAHHAGKISTAVIPFPPYNTISAGGGAGNHDKRTDYYTSYGGVSGLGNGGDGGTYTQNGADGGQCSGGGGGGSGGITANNTPGTNGGKGGDGYVAIYVFGGAEE